MQINQDKLDVIKTVISAGEAFRPSFGEDIILGYLGRDARDVENTTEAGVKLGIDALAKYLGQLADSILEECKD